MIQTGTDCSTDVLDCADHNLFSVVKYGWNTRVNAMHWISSIKKYHHGLISRLPWNDGRIVGQSCTVACATTFSIHETQPSAVRQRMSNSCAWKLKFQQQTINIYNHINHILRQLWANDRLRHEQYHITHVDQEPTIKNIQLQYNCAVLMCAQKPAVSWQPQQDKRPSQVNSDTDFVESKWGYN